MWTTTMGNHGAVGGISERRRSSCPSLLLSFSWLIWYNCILRFTSLLPFLSTLSPSGWSGIVVLLRMGRQLLQTLGKAYLWNHLVDYLLSKLFEFVHTYSCLMSGTFAPWGLAYGPKTCQIWYQWVQTLRNSYLWNHWTGFLHSNFYGFIYSCSCVVSGSLA